MSVEEKSLPDLLGLLYDGLVCPRRWMDFLAELQKQLSCDSATITFHDRENQNPVIGFNLGWPQQQITEWNDYYGRRNPRAPEVLQTALRTGSCISANALPQVFVKYKTSEYLHWLRRVDVYHSIVTAVLCGPGFASLNLMRPKSARPFPDSGQKLMEFLVPHLRRVFQVHSRNETLRALLEAETIALDTLDTGVIAVDEQGCIVLANQRAEAVLEKGQGLAMHSGRLAATHSSEAIHLQRLVSSASMTANGRGTSNGGLITLHGGADSASMSVIVTPFRSSHAFARGRPCALVFICDPAAKAASRTATLRSLFGLTPAECRLAGLLHSGLELRVAAQNIGVTAETARFMLKKIFGKTGSHRQSQLLQMMSRLPGETPRLRQSQTVE